MSFKGSSKSIKIDKRYSTLKLIGGNDCLPGRKAIVPDLDVIGGARIHKTLCAGSVFIDGTLDTAGGLDFMETDVIEYGNITANAVCTTNLKVETITSEVVIEDDLVIFGDLGVLGNTLIDELDNEDYIVDTFTVPEVCTSTFKANTIESNDGLTIEIDTIIEGDLTSQQACFSNLKANAVTINGDGTIVEDLEVQGDINSVIDVVGTTKCISDANQDTKVCANDDDTVSIEIGGNTFGTLQSDGGFAFGTGTSTSGSNSHAVGENATAGTDNSWIFSDGTAASTATPGEFQVNSSSVANINAEVCVNGNLITQGTITDKTGMNDLVESVSCIPEIQADKITDKSGGNIVLNANGVVDLFCGNISNVQALFVDEVFGKASPINFEDNINIRDNHRITFEDEGIKIGDPATTASNAGAISIGKGASASNEDSISLGTNATSINGGIAIGDDASATGSIDSLSIGDSSAATANNSVAIGTSSRALGEVSTAIGLSSITRSSNGVALGSFSRVDPGSDSGISIGPAGVEENAFKGIQLGASSLGFGAEMGISIGRCQTSGNSVIGVGCAGSVDVLGTRAVGIGAQLQLVGTEFVAFGSEAFASADGIRGVAIGTGTTVEGNGVSIGTNVRGFLPNTFSFGSSISNRGFPSVAIGRNLGIAFYPHVITIGVKTISGLDTQAPSCVSIGRDTVTGIQSANAIILGHKVGFDFQTLDTVAIGTQVETSNFTADMVLIGTKAVGQNLRTISIGKDTLTFLSDRICIGTGIQNPFSSSILRFRHRLTVSPAGNDARWVNNEELVETVSSQRFKQNIRDLEEVGEKLDEAKPRRYNPIEEDEESEECIGLIAEEFENQFPELISYEQDGVTPKGISYATINVLLWKELQYLRQVMKDNGLIST